MNVYRDGTKIDNQNHTSVEKESIFINHDLGS